MLLEFVVFPVCHNAVDQYVRVTTNSYHTEPNSWKLVCICNEENTFLEPIFPQKESWFPHSDVYICKLE